MALLLTPVSACKKSSRDKKDPYASYLEREIQEPDHQWLSAPRFPLTKSEVMRLQGDIPKPQWSLNTDPLASQKLLTFYQHLNRLQFKSDLAYDPSLEPKLAALVQDVVIGLVDVNDFVAVGEPVFIACQDAVNGIVEGIKIGKYELKDGMLPDAVLNTEAFKSYRTYCGNPLPLLVSKGLISQNGWQSELSPNLFFALQRQRFAALIAQRLPISKSLPPVDQLLISWWRIMDPNSFSVQERQQHLTNLVLPTQLKDPTSKLHFNLLHAKASILWQQHHTLKPIQDLYAKALACDPKAPQANQTPCATLSL